MNDRSELGHWEADQIIGAHNQSSLLCLTERVTRYSMLITMPEGYSADAMVAGLVDGLDRIPGHLLASIAFDQGSEWANWETIAASYGIDCWFCEPRSPWQRGQIENINRQWRWWFPPRHRPRQHPPSPRRPRRRHHQQPTTGGSRRSSCDPAPTAPTPTRFRSGFMSGGRISSPTNR